MKKPVLTILIIITILTNLKSQTILESVKNNDYEKVLEFINSGSDVNTKDENNATLLMWAVYSGDIAIVKLLFENGADVKQKGAIFTEDGASYYGNLLGLAAGLDKTETLKYLIEVCKIDIEDKELVVETNLENGWTALQWAASAGKNDCLQYLIEAGANINANHTEDAGTPLLYALQNQHTSTSEILIENGADVNLKSAANWYPIHFATNIRMYNILEKLIEAGADVNVKAPDGYNSLVLTAYNYYYSSCKLLLENGADINIKDKNGYSALDYAKMYNYNLIYELMLNPDFEPEINSSNLGELINIAVDYYWSEKYEETAEFLEKIIPLVKESYGETDTTYYGILLSYLAYSYDITENYSSAENYYLKTIDVYQNINKNSYMLAYTTNYLAEMYIKTKDKINAEKYLLETLELYKNIYSETSMIYSNYILSIAYFFHNNLDIENAEIFYLKYIENVKSIYGENNVYYASAIYFAADFYMNFGFYIKAEEYMLEDLRITEEIKGKYNKEFMLSLENIGLLYLRTANYVLAEDNYLKLMDLNKTMYGENSNEFAKTQSLLAGVYSDSGFYDNAEILYLNAINIIKNNKNENRIEYAIAINGLALVYQTKGEYSKAEELLIESVEISKNNYDNNPLDYAVCVGNLAELYRLAGQYEKAEPLYLEAMEVQKNILSENSEDYANTLNNLAILYFNKSEYQKSETAYLNAKEIRKNVLGENHPDYAVTLNNLGLLYQTLGNYEAAIKLFEQAITIRANTIGVNHPAYAVSLNNLGLLYVHVGYFEDSKILFKAAIKIQENNVTGNNPNLATYYDNLAYSYIEMNDIDSAENYILKAKDIKQQQLGEQHLNYAASLTNLAKLYIQKGKYSEAEKLFLESVNITKNNLGSQNIYYSIAISDLALLYIRIKEFEKADKLIIEADEIFNFLLLQSGKYMSEKEREYYVYNTISTYTDIFNSYELTRFEKNPEFNKILYNNTLSHKGLILNSNLAMRNEIQYSDNAELKQLYFDYIENNKILAELYSQPIEIRAIDTDSLENATNILEKQLVTLTDKLNNNAISSNIQSLTSTKVTFENVKNSLQDSEAAIEFISFDNYENEWTGDTLYAALILRKEYEYPKTVYLFNHKELFSIMYKDPKLEEIYSEGNPEYQYIKALYLPSEGKITKSDSLYNAIWQPIEPYLKDIKTIYLSPSGLLNTVSFDAIPYNDSLLLSDIYDINILTSTSKAINKKQLFTVNISKSAIFGGIDYDVDTTTMKTSAMLYKSTSEEEIYVAENFNAISDIDLSAVSRGGVWNYIEGADKEAQIIKNAFDAKKIKTDYFTGEFASEEAFKSLSENTPSVIHVATHGFYFANDEKTKSEFSSLGNIQYVFSDDPLLRSGLVFSGGNRIWSGDKIPEGIEDGVLTAYDVSQMNLLENDLVVLSACQTGLGDVIGNEGVYGLQRAFKKAGSDFMIVTLWQVPDVTTQQLMENFYTFWLSGDEIHDAFRKAQNVLKAKYSAYGWAAFILIE